MKLVKGISLFFIYPCMMLAVGLYAGIMLDRYFYPGQSDNAGQMEESVLLEAERQTEEETAAEGKTKPEETSMPVSVREEEVLTADTEYVIEEYDTKRDTLVETVWKVPAKYLGMDRKTFVQTMELYALSPPLSEQQRGFVGLEVRSFSAKRVVVRMNYAYAEPTASFYLRVENNNIVVYCDDNETVYMYTDICAQTLPEYIQTQVIMGMFMEDEAELYHFLETYSS